MCVYGAEEGGEGGRVRTAVVVHDVHVVST